MREAISILAIIVAFFFFIAFGSAIFMALEDQMHWVLAFFAMAWLIVLRLWFVLPVLAYLGAHNVWGWPWYWAVALAAPVAFYVVSYYWTLLTDYLRRPIQEQGV